jgi:hypothetical protein
VCHASPHSHNEQRYDAWFKKTWPDNLEKCLVTVTINKSWLKERVNKEQESGGTGGSREVLLWLNGVRFHRGNILSRLAETQVTWDIGNRSWWLDRTGRQDRTARLDRTGKLDRMTGQGHVQNREKGNLAESGLAGGWYPDSDCWWHCHKPKVGPMGFQAKKKKRLKSSTSWHRWPRLLESHLLPLPRLSSLSTSDPLWVIFCLPFLCPHDTFCQQAHPALTAAPLTLIQNLLFNPLFTSLPAVLENNLRGFWLQLLLLYFHTTPDSSQPSSYRQLKLASVTPVINFFIL